MKKWQSGVHTIIEVWRMAKGKGLNVGKSQFWNILKNPIYCGKIFIPAYKDEEATIKKAAHELLISEMLFDDVQDILNGRKRKFSIKKTVREEFPLRGFLECRKCGGKLTASKSKGNGGYYYYYHCTKGCDERIKAEETNDALIKKLCSYTPNNGSVQLMELIVKNAKAPSSEKEIYQKSILKDIEKYNQRIRNIQEQLSDKEISSKDYNEMKTRYEKEIRNLERDLSKSKGGDKELCEEILFSIQLVTDLPAYYDSSDLICRQQILGSIFLEKMVFQDGELRTKKVNSAVELLCRPPKDFKEIENKKSSENSELSNLVPRTGFEPRNFPSLT